MPKHETQDEPTALDNALWRGLELGEAKSQPVDPGRVAAWLDNRLHGAERDAVEDLMARSPEWCDAMLAAAQSGDVSLPATVAQMAKKIGEATTEPTVSPVAAWYFGWRRLASAGAMASAVILVSAGGFAIGQQTYRDLAAISDMSSQARLLLNDPLLDDGPDIFTWEG